MIYCDFLLKYKIFDIPALMLISSIYTLLAMITLQSVDLQAMIALQSVDLQAMITLQSEYLQAIITR